MTDPQQPPPVHLYFDYLTTYSLSLVPLSLISAGVYLYFPSDSYPPLYAFILSLYAATFVATWRIKERKLAVRWGTRGSESVAVGRLRPEYVANLGLDKSSKAQSHGAIDTLHAGNSLKRESKVVASIPLIIACGVFLGVVLTGIFILEAFVAAAYDGPGKQIVVSRASLPLLGHHSCWGTHTSPSFPLLSSPSLCHNWSACIRCSHGDWSNGRTTPLQLARKRV